MVRKKKKRARSKKPFSILVLSVLALVLYLNRSDWWPLINPYALHVATVGGLALALWLYRLMRRLKLASTMTEIDAI